MRHAQHSQQTDLGHIQIIDTDADRRVPSDEFRASLRTEIDDLIAQEHQQGSAPVARPHVRAGLMSRIMSSAMVGVAIMCVWMVMPGLFGGIFGSRVLEQAQQQAGSAIVAHVPAVPGMVSGASIQHDGSVDVASPASRGSFAVALAQQSFGKTLSMQASRYKRQQRVASRTTFIDHVNRVARPHLAYSQMIASRKQQVAIR